MIADFLNWVDSSWWHPFFVLGAITLFKPMRSYSKITIQTGEDE